MTETKIAKFQMNEKVGYAKHTGEYKEGIVERIIKTVTIYDHGYEKVEYEYRVRFETDKDFNYDIVNEEKIFKIDDDLLVIIKEANERMDHHGTIYNKIRKLASEILYYGNKRNNTYDIEKLKKLLKEERK